MSGTRDSAESVAFGYLWLGSLINWRSHLPPRFRSLQHEMNGASPDNHQIPEIVGCISVGYLIAKTKRAIALVPNLGDIVRELVQASGIIGIPHSAVRQMIEL